MNSEKKLMLEKYIKSGISPILLENIPTSIFEEAVVLEANCDLSLLNGHYEGLDFVAPSWYNKLINQKENPILIISEINKISQKEQTKFIEILKYKKTV